MAPASFFYSLLVTVFQNTRPVSPNFKKQTNKKQQYLLSKHGAVGFKANKANGAV